MPALRQRMIDDLRLRGYADRTVEAYVGAVARLAQFHHTAPDRLSAEQLRTYLLHLTTERKLTRPSLTVALCGLRFFYEQTLQRPWTILDVARPRRDKKLPVVLSRNEVWQVLAAVGTPAYRSCLTTISACGLRLLEGTQLQAPRVDSDRRLLHVHRGKGGVDRDGAAPAGDARAPPRALAHASQPPLGVPRAAPPPSPDRSTIPPSAPSALPRSRRRSRRR